MDIESFFDDDTMSVHLRENNFPYAKKGTPGNASFERIRDKKLGQDELKSLAKEIMEAEDSSIEIDRHGSTIIQKGRIRIVLTRPPFSDGWEITAVRPVRLLDLDEYKITDKLMARIQNNAEGILVAGSPGQGKSTFARALALYYAGNKNIVKTVESPRDLILPETITQLAISHGSPEEVRDILLLSRPDYTIFDEMRNTDDFKLFSDLRLSGVGMVGIIHATNAVDAIQRFIGRIELGVIPQIIDTVIFIKNGFIEKVFEIKMTVKVPTGMIEADLARPVVIVNDFETGKLEFEIYSYGEDTVVVPVSETSKSLQNISKLIGKKLSVISKNIKIEEIDGKIFRIHVPEDELDKLLKESSKTLAQIKKELGISLEIKPIEKDYELYEFTAELEKRHITIIPKNDMTGKELEIYIDGDFLLRAKVGKKNSIKISRPSEQGKRLDLALDSKKKVELRG